MSLQDVTVRIGFDASMTSSLDVGMAVVGLRYCSMDDGISVVQWMMELGVVRWMNARGIIRPMMEWGMVQWMMES